MDYLNEKGEITIKVEQPDLPEKNIFTDETTLINALCETEHE